MADLATSIKLRGYTRTKVTKLVSKAEALLADHNEDEIPVIIESLESCAKTLAKQNDEVMKLLPDADTETEIDKVLDYELKIGNTINSLKKSLPSFDERKHLNAELVEILKQQNLVSMSLKESQEKMMLPQRTLECFDGSDITKFKTFIKSFRRLIEEKTNNDSDRLYYLEQYTKSLPQELVRSCSHMDPSRGYSTAMKLLSEKYDNDFSIASAFIDKIEAWPSIKPEDGPTLEKFCILLTSCLNYAKDVKALEQLNSPKEMLMILSKLPYKLREKWRGCVLGLQESSAKVTFKELVQFVTRESKLLNMPVFGNLKTPQTKPSSQYQTNEPRKPNDCKKTTSMATAVDNRKIQMKPVCLCCGKDNHSMENCFEFKNRTYEERREFVKDKNLCFGCLKKGHRSKDCFKRLSCTVCKRKHPTPLHTDDYPRQPSRPNSSPLSQTLIETTNCHTGAGTSSKVALALIPVKIRSKHQETCITTYAGLDNFSSDCFISEQLVKKLQATGPSSKILLTTMEHKRSEFDTRIINNLEIFDIDENENIKLPPTYTCKELPIGNDDVPREEDIEKWPTLRDLPFNFVDAEVGLILGINSPEAIKCLEIVSTIENGPFASRHKLGWALNGPLTREHRHEVFMHRTQVENTQNIESMLEEMYSYDFPDSKQDGIGFSVEDKMWKQRVDSSVTFQDGHYVIKLPFRSEDPVLPDNRNQAYQRIASTKRRLERNSKLHVEYTSYMKEMIEKDFAEKIPETELKREPGKSWYLVHHGVYHKEKGNLRVVFNCSLKYRGTSLNDELLQGPDLTNGLLGVLLRFRQGAIAMTADIEKMFYQVKVPKEHSDFLRFFWFPDGNLEAEPEEYRLKVHVFGAVSSPSCANYALQKSAFDNQSFCSQSTVDTILNNFYVDDWVVSLDNIENAMSLAHEAQETCRRGGFCLSKFVSNSPQVMEAIPRSSWAKNIKELNLDHEDMPCQRALGVKWNVTKDNLSFKVNLQEQPNTRRGVLSTIFSIYDIFGFVGPAILPAKRIFQEICRLKCSWDEPLIPEHEIAWKKWINDLPRLTSYSLPRCYRPFEFEDSICELHIFCDGSEVGYGAVAYLRFENKSGEIHCILALAKSRLAPLKRMTIPRLELTAAKLAVIIKCTLEKEIDFDISRIFFWTDSTVTLKYINNTTKRFQRFVANRVAFIHERTEPDQWFYVFSKQNPADYASRGVPIRKFLELKDWSNGPSFLYEPKTCWPKLRELAEIDESDPEVCKEKRILAVKTEPGGIGLIAANTSSWIRLKRKIAWLIKIKNRLLKHDENNEISQCDLDKAELVLMRYLQKQSFPKELKLLLQDLPVPEKSSLSKLNPFLDENGLMRVGGRLRNAERGNSAQCHPIILPKQHHISRLIILYTHEKVGHLGRETTLAALREHFWIIQANSATRNLLKKCVICRKQQGKTSQQIMADLPKDRLQGDHAPFTNVGIDYFGPFYVKRGRSTEKRYGVIFSCLESRAVHLEIAYSLDTSSFLNVLRRFISRRGQPQLIRSDNGTNLVGGNSELKRSIEEWNQIQIKNTLQQKNTEWIFHPPAASNFGGVWEREIRTARKILNSLLLEQRIKLSDDNLATLMCEVEAIMNQRPLTTVSDDPLDPQPLTPNDLLMTKSQIKTTFPPGLFSPSDTYTKKRWRQVQYLTDVFWKRWRQEYISQLQQRQKWIRPSRNFVVNDIVLISQQNLPRNQWPLGRVTSVTEKDGKVRVARIKTIDSEIERPINKLVLIVPNET
jgi:hypothetical protein